MASTQPPPRRVPTLEKLLLGLLAVDLLALVGLIAFVQSSGSHSRVQRSHSSTDSPAALAGGPSPSPAELASPTPLPSPAVPPPARADAAMAYDDATQSVVMFGGESGGKPLADTWTWDGQRWTQQTVPGPSARSGAGMAYDAARRQVVLFGGFDGGWLNDTWTWDGSSWTRKSPATVLRPRAFASMAYDPRQGTVLLYGGQGAVTYASTWSWDGADWRLLASYSPPGRRHRPGLAYDPSRGVVVLYGGSAPGARLHDTWEWNGAYWAARAGGPAAARGWTEMAFGGSPGALLAVVSNPSTDAAALDRFISWDGVHWTQLASSQVLGSRTGEALAYDAAAHQLVVFGGLAGGHEQGDTCVWDGSGWSAR